MEESNILARMGWKLGSWKDSGVELVHSPSAREAHQQLVVTHPPASTKCEGLSGHFNASKNIKLYGDVIAASANLTPEKSACGGCCKTCTRTHCVLVEAGSVDAGEIAGFKKLQAPSFR